MQEEATLLQKPHTYKSKAKISLIVFNIALSSFYCGYNFVNVAQISLDTIRRTFYLQPWNDSIILALLNALIPIGATIGVIISHFFIHRLSRRNCLLVINAIALLAGAAIFLPNFQTLVISRIVQGFCVGAYNALIPLIIKELSPKQLSGSLGSYNPILFCFGIFFACIFRYLLYKITGDSLGQNIWLAVFGFTEVTVAFQTVVLLFVFPYQTPRYLLQVGKQQQAKKLTSVIYKHEFVEQVLIENTADMLVASHLQDKSATNPQKKPTNKVPIFVAIHLSVLQIVSAMVPIAFYGSLSISVYKINKIDGLPLDQQLRQIFSSLINVGPFLGAFTTAFLLKRFGRKKLLQIGSLLTGAGNLIMAVGFFLETQAGLVLLFVGLFSVVEVFGITLGAIVWIYIPEIVQAKVVTFALAVNWFVAALILILFPILTDYTQTMGTNVDPTFVFLFFASWCFVSALVNWKFVIQTKDKTQKAIRQEFQKNL